MDSPLTVLEIVLRYASAVSLSVSAVFVTVQVRRGRLRPWQAWTYVDAVVMSLALWRWVVVLLIPPSSIPTNVIDILVPWVQPVNQALYTLAGIAVLILAIVGSRARRDD